MGLKEIHLLISDVDENLSLNTDNHVSIGDAACYSLRGNVHKEPARVFTNGVSWRQSLSRSSSLMVWEKVWTSYSSIETMQIFSNGTMVDYIRLTKALFILEV